jgi:methylated-DNA-[protein]-cysteine S-methyltransferase
MIDVDVENVGGMWFGVAFEGETVQATSFASTKEDVLRGLKGELASHVTTNSVRTDFSRRVIATLKDMYDGKENPANFKFASDHLPKYTWKILETMRKVPLGYVTSYGEIAKTAGGGPRAVGQIMARNPFAPIYPCHRVVRSDLTLGGYGGGLAMKLAFLKRERQGFSGEKEIPLPNGKKLRVYPVERAIRKAEEGKR